MDPDDLLSAVENELQSDNLDYRSRLLVRESLLALQNRWGSKALSNRLSSSILKRANDLLTSHPGEIGFPTLGDRMRERTDSATILEFLRELGQATHQTTRLEIGGSTALILNDLLRRGTDDIDVVNEVPAVLRTNHDLLNRLSSRHGLLLTHFQSHYLPTGYEHRLHYLDRFGDLDVYLVDPLDIFVGKLFSKRDKDLDDLRMLKSNFSLDEIVDRLRSSATELENDQNFLQNARRNWYILFGQPLPA